MSQFVFLYRNELTAAPPPSPEQAQQTMQRWMAWFKTLQDKGHVKDMGAPLDRGGKVVRGKAKTITDGPFLESKDIVGGFSIIEARDLSHAAELSLGCPIFEAGGAVEVRPVMQMNM